MSLENIILIGVPTLILIAIIALMYFDARRELKGDYLANALTRMHGCLLRLARERQKKIKDTKWVEESIPELVHSWGLIDIGDWDKYKSSTLARIKRHMPKTNLKAQSKWFKVASEASKIKREFFSLKEWGVEDIYKIGEWLDRQGKGISALRDKDKEWNSLNRSIEPYMADRPLRELIKKHKDYSWAYCSVWLVQHVFDKSHNEPVTNMIWNILSGLPISAEQMSEDLHSVLDDIRKRQRMKRKNK